MRITGGVFGGRRLQAPRGLRLRPTQDRVREALFSSIASDLPGATFLDLYAGVGTVGVEAWSRGASRVCWVERDRVALGCLREHVANLEASGEAPGVRLQVQASDVMTYLKRAGSAFDFVFADPPYVQHGGAGAGCVMDAVAAGGACRVGGILVLEQGVDEPGSVHDAFRLLREKPYGGSMLRIYQREHSL